MKEIHRNMEEQVEETMLCAGKIHSAEVSPFLFSKITGRIKASERVSLRETRIIRFALIVILIIVINLVTFLSIPSSDNNTKTAGFDSKRVFAKEYFSTNNYNIY